MKASTTASAVPLSALLGLVMLAGCGDARGTRDPGTHAHHAAPPASRAVEVQYDDRERVEGQPFRIHVDVITRGADHARIRLVETGMAPMLFVWDGQRLLVHDASEYRPWTLYEAPAEHPDAFGLVEAYLPDPGGRHLERDCRSAAVVGHRTILGLEATGYHCAAQHFPDGSSRAAYEIWLDATSGRLLQEGHLHVSSIESNPTITSDAFSTEPPPDAALRVVGARTGHGGTAKDAADFHVKRPDGSTARLSDYAGRPLVLAFFTSELYFDPGDACPGCLRALLTLQRLTDNGSHPAVLAIQTGEDQSKPGYKLSLPGVRLDVALDPGFDVESAYGLEEQVAFAFVGSDGKVHRTFDKAPTDTQIRAAIAELQ